MNKEIIKAMNRQPKKENKLHKWWRKNAHIVARIVFFPIWIVMVINQKIEIVLDKHNKWNEERADEILKYYIPRRATWDNENKEFYFCDNGFGGDNAKKDIKIKDRRLWNNHHGGCGGKLRSRKA